MTRIFRKLAAALLFVAIMGISPDTSAQSSQLSDDQRMLMKEEMMEYMSALDLSEDQRIEYQEITMKYGEQMKALRSSDKSKMSRFKEMKSIRKNKDEEMRNLLTDEQFEIYKEQQQEMQQKMKEKRKAGHRRH